MSPQSSAPAPAPAVLETQEDSPLDDALGCFASGVVVVTTTAPDGPTGMTVSSFTPLSMQPPLVLFCASNASTTWPRISRCGAFVINILSHEQDDIARAFARRGARRFSGIQPGRSPSGLPVLPGVLAYLDCRIDRLWPGGDHMVVVGRVRHAARLTQAAPLLRLRGELC
jgi:3-hydroxy-9,10-secoandrosta-1,3,5(10)-triene-9,17-dione monooxygenase reductase component